LNIFLRIRLTSIRLSINGHRLKPSGENSAVPPMNFFSSPFC